MASLASLYPTLTARGAKVAAVTMGTPAEAEEFCGARAPGVICLSDIGQRAFRAFGIGRATPGALLAPEVFAAGAAATLEGYLPGRPVGDTLQMPATFVVAQGGTVRLAYYSRTVADHPADAVILRTLET